MEKYPAMARNPQAPGLSVMGCGESVHGPSRPFQGPSASAGKGRGGRRDPRGPVTMTRYIVLSCVLALAAWPVHAAEGLRSFDRNGDGKIDQWEYYSGSTLIRVEIDRDL